LEVETTSQNNQSGKPSYEPLIISFNCNWCSYVGADLAGIKRLQYPSNVRIIRTMCSGTVHPSLVINALTKGADGVMICGCHPGDCHYQKGNLSAQQKAEAIRLMIEDFGLEPERFRLELVSAAEGNKYAEIVKDMTETLKKLGPSPFKM